jgi:hypothetical protein
MTKFKTDLLPSECNSTDFCLVAINKDGIEVRASSESLELRFGSTWTGIRGALAKVSHNLKNHKDNNDINIVSELPEHEPGIVERFMMNGQRKDKLVE